MKRPSRSKAFRSYLREFHAVDHPGNYSAEQKKQVYTEIRETLKRAKGRLAATVRAACYNCVGGVDSVNLRGEPSPGGDPGGRERVRDCSVTKCPLHPVRPWQNLKGRPRKAGQDPAAEEGGQGEEQDVVGAEAAEPGEGSAAAAAEAAR